MKLLIRFMGLSIIGMIYLLMFMEMMNRDVLYNELNYATAMAMNETQIIMSEQIEDRYYHTDNARKNFMSDNEYIGEFIDNFRVLISSNAKYDIEVYEADIEEGILDVNVILHYKRINGEDVTMNVRKTGIVDVLLEEG